MFNLEGKIALVTGAGRGIGEAIALTLAQNGAHIHCVSRTLENAERTATTIAKLGQKSWGHSCDVSNTASVEELFNNIIENSGAIDILVNNAGVTRDGLIVRMKEQDWDEVVDTNLKGAFLCIRSAAKVMMKARTGSIVNVGSVVGIAGNAGQTNYSASKAGLIGLTKSVAKELGSRGITCNLVAPGFIQTDMTHGLSEETKKKVTENCAAGRLGTSEEVAKAVLFFCSEDARYVTGQVLCVDGGLSL